MLDRLVGGALQQTPGHKHALTTMGLLSKWKLLLRPPKHVTISTQSHWQWRSYFNESSSSPGGWDHAAGNREMISTHLCSQSVLWGREVEGEEDEEGEKLGRVQSTMHQPAGLTLQSSALPSTSFFSCFSLYLFFASYLNTSQEFIPLLSFSIVWFQKSISPVPHTNMLILHCPRVIIAMEKKYLAVLNPLVSLREASHHSLHPNPVSKLTSLQLSACHSSNLPFTCFLFFLLLVRSFLSFFLSFS